MFGFIKFSIVLLCLISSAQAKTYFHESYFDDFFSDQLIEEVQAVNSHLLRKFPPNKYTYIFVGRSLSLNRLILEIKGYPSVELPFSGANLHETISDENRSKFKIRLRQHFEDHLPSLFQIKPSGLVLVDFMSSGSSLRRAELEVNAFYNGLIPIKTYSVTRHRVLFNGFSSGYRLSRESRLYINLRMSNFSNIAEFPRYFFDKEDPNPESNFDPQIRIEAKRWLQQKLNPQNLCFHHLSR